MKEREGEREERETETKRTRDGVTHLRFRTAFQRFQGQRDSLGSVPTRIFGLKFDSVLLTENPKP